MELNSDNVSTQQLGHLGLIGSVIRDLGIIEKIDARIPLNETKGGIVSYGKRAAAMILNGLGFMNSRLYMTQHFFQDKPVAQLLDSDVCAENLNDDCLGRCLDKVADYGVTKLFSEIAFEVAKENNLLSRRLHMDTTSFVLYGEYDEENTSPQPTYGYSKAHRHDLKQVMLSLTQGGAANLPLWMEPLNGNSSDTKSFHETVRRIQTFMSQLKEAPDNLCFVADAAFYDTKKLEELDKVRWITRIPSKLKLAKELLQSTEDKLTWHEIDENYKKYTQTVNIDGFEQRWILIKSSQAFKRELNTLMRRLNKDYESLKKELWHLSNKKFGCFEDAEKSIKAIIKKQKYYDIRYEVLPIEKYESKGRPNSKTPKKIVGYRVNYAIASDLTKIKQKKEKLGRFILGTNQLDQKELSDTEVLEQYKEQSHVESGFKFIKDNTFELDSFFLNTPRRIGALMMIMTLCLMVYNFAQYKLRKCLDEADDILPNQHGKPTQKPTMKWIAEMMVVIAVVTIKTSDMKQRIVTNVNQVHRKIIGYFGQNALKIYGLPDDYEQTAINYSNYKNFLDWCEM